MSHITSLQQAFMNVNAKQAETPLGKVVLNSLVKRVQYGAKLDHEFAVKRAVSQAESRIAAEKLAEAIGLSDNITEQFLAIEEENEAQGYVGQ